MNYPLVSILIPVFNRENILSKTIESAIAQNYANIEIIIVDNYSTDGTWEIIEKYSKKDNRIKAFRNTENIGPVRNWLACVDKASGVYSKILWSDDLIHPDFLRKLVPFLNDPTVGFAYSSTIIFTDEPLDSETILFSKMASGIYHSERFIEDTFLVGDLPVSPGCAVFRTIDVKNNLILHVPNGVCSDFSMHAIGNDLLLFLLTAHKYKNFAVINEPLSYFRAHEGSITVASSSEKVTVYYDLAKGFFAEKYIDKIGFLKKINCIFLIHILYFNFGKFGIKSIKDFYPNKKYLGLDYIFFIKIIIYKIFKKIIHLV